ncbi:heavy-metal-associated domain-containing protein [Marinoscillum pacificum]|uniref:heavy-metal-associated domain-containing protein n=1 Tax=Marinoscillum pacificum TaxID=392723 RepID=UPI0021588E62|nr:heavy metal-associated domain-containing protein [Marinoscillum pacificum]
METKIIVDNLKCGGCANTIKNNLQKVEGVNAVAVEVETSEVTLLHEFAVSKQTLLDKLSSLGYPQQGTSTGMQKVKSYVSCAVGRMS